MSDAERLELLDRLADRLPELDLDEHSISWTTLDDGAEPLLVDGAGFDGGDGAFLVNYGDDVHAVGSMAAVRGLPRRHRDPGRMAAGSSLG